MQQSLSSKANIFFSASLEIPRVLWNLHVHYRIHICPYPEPDQSCLRPHVSS